MAVFEYQGYDAAGKRAHGMIDADSPRGARNRLRTQGIMATAVEEATGRGELVRNPFATLANRIGAKQIALFTRQLATLLSGGLTLTESLEALVEQSPNPRLKRVVTSVREQILQGSTLADALGGHPGQFDPLYLALVKAGEAAGALDQTLERLAQFHEARLRQRSTVMAALLYPGIMALVGCGVLFYLLTSVVPQVESMFTDMRQALPLATVALLAVSRLMGEWWWAILLGAALGLAWFDRWRRTPGGKERIDAGLLRLPVFGELVRTAAVSRFARSLAVLLTGGVSLVEGLKITAETVDHALLSRAVEGAVEKIMEGQAIAPPLKASGLFPPLVTQMVAAGERTGSLPAMLERIAEAYEFEVETAVSALTSLVEPLLILTMGGVVGFVVMAILLPIFELSQMAG